jgi:uncharacterized membrane protein YraQ (UPF0718 family)
MERKRRVQTGTLLMVLGLLTVLVGLAWTRGGGAQLREGFGNGADLLLRMAPIVAISLLAAGFVEALVPQEWVRETFGHESGMRGILVATGAGIVTPTGPFVSMPIAAVLIRSGAGPAAVVTYLAAWSLLAMHRFIAWEVPILGLRFALIRWVACLALPAVAGLLTRLISR